MDIGESEETRRVLIVEPLTLPPGLPAPETPSVPEPSQPVPVTEPEAEPVAVP